MKEWKSPKICADLLIRRRRFVSLTIALFLIYTGSVAIFDRVVASEQSHFLGLDQDPLSRPGSTTHKYRGVGDMYSIRGSSKARLCMYKASNTVLRILRVDMGHDLATTEHWLKTRYNHYADLTPGRGGPK